MSSPEFEAWSLPRFEAPRDANPASKYRNSPTMHLSLMQPTNSLYLRDRRRNSGRQGIPSAEKTSVFTLAMAARSNFHDGRTKLLGPFSVKWVTSGWCLQCFWFVYTGIISTNTDGYPIQEPVSANNPLLFKVVKVLKLEESVLLCT